MKLTTEQYDILDCILIHEDPQDYCDRACNNPTFTEQTVLDKIERHKSAYEKAVKEPDYKTGRQRTADEREQSLAERKLRKEARETRQAEEDAKLQSKIDEAVARALGL